MLHKHQLLKIKILRMYPSSLVIMWLLRFVNGYISLYFSSDGIEKIDHSQLQSDFKTKYIELDRRDSVIKKSFSQLATTYRAYISIGLVQDEHLILRSSYFSGSKKQNSSERCAYVARGPIFSINEDLQLHQLIYHPSLILCI